MIKLYAMAIASKKFAWDKIDEEYSKRREEYDRAFCEVSDKYKYFLDIFVADMEDNLIKMIAMLEVCNAEKDLTTVNKIAKYAYKRAYNSYKRAVGNKLYVDGVIQDLICKVGQDNISEAEIVNEMIMMDYFCRTNGVNIIYGSAGIMTRDYIELVEDTEKRIKGDVKISEERIERALSRINGLGLDNKFLKEEFNVGLVLEKLISVNENRQCLKEYGMPLMINEKQMRLDLEKYKAMRSRSFVETDNRIIGVYSDITKEFGWAESNLDFTGINKDELIRIADRLIGMYNYGQIKEDEYNVYFIASIYIVSMIKEYHEVKKKYLIDNKLEMNRRMREAEDEACKVRASAKKELEDINRKLDSKDKEIEELKQKLAEAAKENSRLRKELEETEENNKELISIRRFLYNSSVEGVVREDKEEKYKEEFIRGKKIAVFGGHPNWHNKLRKISSNIITVETEKLSIDLNFIRNLDGVFIHTSYCNHSMYNKLMHILRELDDVKLGYTDSVNIGRTINTMYSVLK